MFKNLFRPDIQKEFWKWFEQNQEHYYHFENNEDQLFNLLSKKLKAINEGLVFEFGPINSDGKRELSISADGIKKVFPYVIELVEKAPDLPNWKFNSFRQRVPGDGIVIRFGEKIKLGYPDIFFRYGKDGNKIGIELNIKDYIESNPIKNATYILLDGLLGEYDMETKISWIEFKKLDEENIQDMYPLIELRNIVDSIPLSN